MSTLLTWIFWIVILTFGGYIVNRILFWTGAFIWQWSKQVMFEGEIWFDEGTTIVDICNDIKYQDGYKQTRNHDNYYKDSYSLVNTTKWVPGVNIMFSVAMFCINIIGFALALLCEALRLTIIFCRYILCPYCLKWVFKGIIKIVKALCWVLVKLRIVNFYFYLKKIYQKTIYNLLHSRIA
jgi:hypothetical protein